jgi:hypothetical protein
MAYTLSLHPDMFRRTERHHHGVHKKFVTVGRLDALYLSVAFFFLGLYYTTLIVKNREFCNKFDLKN